MTLSALMGELLILVSLVGVFGLVSFFFAESGVGRFILTIAFTVLAILVLKTGAYFL